MGLIKKFASQTEIKDWLQDNEAIVKQLFMKKNITARKFAENQNVEYDRRFQKLLGELFPKKMGHGGSRIGSGNKKGKIKFCGICKKQLQPGKKCSCQPIEIFAKDRGQMEDWLHRLEQADALFKKNKKQLSLTLDKFDAKNILGIREIDNIN